MKIFPHKTFGKLRQSGLARVTVIAAAAVAIGIVTIGIMNHSYAATQSVTPTRDVNKSSVVGVANTTALYKNIDDGQSFSLSDNDKTYVRSSTGVATASHTVGYAGAALPTGTTVTSVSVNVRASRGSAGAASVKVELYDGTRLLGTSPSHTLGSSYANYTDTIPVSGLTTTAGLNTKIILSNTSGTGSPRYTQAWIQTTTTNTTNPTTPADLVITNISWSPATPATGNQVVFSATIKNQGGTATPAIKHGLAFRVDGTVYSWSSSITAPLAPGESRVQTANDGPVGVNYWTATAGTHTIRAEIDDSRIITESNETNNILSTSLTTLDTNPNPGEVGSATPCVGSPAPAAWKHVVVLMFENTIYNEITPTSAPWINSMQTKCGSYANWKDANYKVTGATDGSYTSKPNYATLTSGVSPTAHRLVDNNYVTTSGVDNIYNRLNDMGQNSIDYYMGPASTTPCSASQFSGAYHVATRFFTNLGGQSTDPNSFCNTHNKPIEQFMTDVNAGNLPAFSMIYPTNQLNMHDNSISSGDAWAKDFLVPLLDSAAYKSGDTAVFFMWDEDYPIPNVLMAPSIRPGTQPPTPTGNPISHFSVTRTWQEMLGVSPLLGDTAQAPSLLNYYNGQ